MKTKEEVIAHVCSDGIIREDEAEYCFYCELGRRGCTIDLTASELIDVVNYHMCLKSAIPLNDWFDTVEEIKTTKDPAKIAANKKRIEHAENMLQTEGTKFASQEKSFKVLKKRIQHWKSYDWERAAKHAEREGLSFVAAVAYLLGFEDAKSMA